MLQTNPVEKEITNDKNKIPISEDLIEEIRFPSKNEVLKLGIDICEDDDDNKHYYQLQSITYGKNYSGKPPQKTLDITDSSFNENFDQLFDVGTVIIDLITDESGNLVIHNITHLQVRNEDDGSCSDNDKLAYARVLNNQEKPTLGGKAKPEDALKLVNIIKGGSTSSSSLGVGRSEIFNKNDVIAGIEKTPSKRRRYKNGNKTLKQNTRKKRYHKRFFSLRNTK
jgi:hypothetical protein